MTSRKIFLGLVAALVSLCLVDIGLRNFVEPLNYLKPTPIDDPALGHRLAPGSGGHDAWGFRNPNVPERADVVAIGDSQTWGVNAGWEQSWPLWYSSLTGRSVYNLGVGGYGPAEYWHLLETRAVPLEPELIIVGLYYGNDFNDAYRSVVSRDLWTSLRTPRMEEVEVEVRPSPAQRYGLSEPLWGARAGLRRNSMLYRLLEAGPIGHAFGSWAKEIGIVRRKGCTLTTSDPFPTTFRPEARYRSLNLEDQAITDGVGLTLTFLERMAQDARDRGIDFLVLLIPSKASVVVGQPDGDVDGACARVLQQVRESEEKVANEVRSFLERRGIDFVDALPALRAAALAVPVYPGTTDGHPNGYGYKVIAEQVARRWESS